MCEPHPTAATGAAERAQALATEVVTVWRLQSIARWSVTWIVATSIGAFLLPTLRWVPAVVTALAAVTAVTIMPGWRHHRWRWQLTNDALELSHGIFIRRHVAVPYFRIQQIDVTRSPLERLMGIATVEVTTASATGTARIPGIAAMEAPRLRSTLIDRAHTATAGFDGDSRDAV